MKITNELVKKYEKIIHKKLQNKYNLLNYEEYEDLVQEGRCLIIEGLQTKYDPKRGSVCTFLYLYLDSRLGAINSSKQKKDMLGYRNMKNRVGFKDSPSFKVRSQYNIVNDTKIRFIVSKLSKNKKNIMVDFFLLGVPLKKIAKKLGNRWNANRVWVETEKIRKFFKDVY